MSESKGPAKMWLIMSIERISAINIQEVRKINVKFVSKDGEVVLHKLKAYILFYFLGRHMALFFLPVKLSGGVAF